MCIIRRSSHYPTSTSTNIILAVSSYYAVLPLYYTVLPYTITILYCITTYSHTPSFLFSVTTFGMRVFILWCTLHVSLAASSCLRCYRIGTPRLHWDFPDPSHIANRARLSPRQPLTPRSTTFCLPIRRARGRRDCRRHAE